MANPWIFKTMRCRSAFESTATSSLPAEAFIRTLYEATSLHALHEAIKGLTPFLFASIEGRKIGNVLCQRYSNRLINHVRNGALICGGA